jgi:hypothetical protein
MTRAVRSHLQVSLEGFWQRQKRRAATRARQLAQSLVTDLPVYYNRRRSPAQIGIQIRNPLRPGIPPTFEMPRTHHTHCEFKEARHANPS